MQGNFPSPDLLRGFEACARLLSFTAAAAELGTIQPATGQHIQRLEHLLATRLFDRVYRGIELTEPGALLLDHVPQALKSVRAGVEAVSAQAPREVLAVATDFAFAACWFQPAASGISVRLPSAAAATQAAVAPGTSFCRLGPWRVEGANGLNAQSRL